MEDGEEVVQVRGHGLPCVEEGEVPYSLEQENLSDREAVVVLHVHPMVALLLGEEVELLCAVKDHLVLVVPCGEDGLQVAAALQDVS